MDAKEKRTDRKQGGDSTAGLSDAVDKLLTDSATRQAFAKDPISTLEQLGVPLSDEVKGKCRATMEAAQMEAVWPMVIARARTETMTTSGPIVYSWPLTHTQTFTHGPWVFSRVQTGVQADAISPVRQARVADLTADELQVIISSAVDRLLSGLAKLRDRPGISNA